MPSVQVHLQQAKSNEESAIADQSKYPDWSVTKCFYAALHYIEAYAVSRGHDIESMYPDRNLSPHKKRMKYVDDISTENDWDDLPIIYKEFYRASKRSRYLEGITTTSKWYFRLGCNYYLQQLEILKERLEIVKIEANSAVKKTC